MSVLYFFAFITVIILTHHCIFTVSQDVVCNGKVVGEFCYLQMAPNTWENANRTCSNNGGTMPTLHTYDTRRVLLELMKSSSSFSSTGSIWLAGQSQTHDWAWTNGAGTVMGQGCWKDYTNYKDYPYEFLLEQSLSNYSRSLCVTACKTQTSYTSVQYAAVRGSSSCFCGYGYGRYNYSNACTEICRGQEGKQPEVYCGGAFSNYVMALDSVYGRWGYQQPLMETKSELCAAMTLKVDNYDLISFGCERKLKYVCQLPTSKCKGSAGYQMISVNCIYLSQERKTFHNARFDCISKEGDLVSLESEEKHNSINQFLSSQNHQLEETWVGLTKRDWFWISGANTSANVEIFNFTWADGQPDEDLYYESTKNPDPIESCLSMDGSGKWWDISCQAARPYFCQIPLPTTTTTSTTTTTTTSMTTTTTPTTTTPRTTTTPTTTSTTTPSTTTVTTTLRPGVSTPTPATETTTKKSTIATKPISKTSTTTAKTPGPSEPSVTTDPSSGSSTGDSPVLSLTYIIIISVIAGLIVLVVIATVTFVCCKKKRGDFSVGRVNPEPEDAANHIPNEHSAENGVAAYPPPDIVVTKSLDNGTTLSARTVETNGGTLLRSSDGLNGLSNPQIFADGLSGEQQEYLRKKKEKKEKKKAKKEKKKSKKEKKRIEKQNEFNESSMKEKLVPNEDKLAERDHVSLYASNEHKLMKERQRQSNA